MAISTYKTFLMIGDGGSWSKLIDIKEYPDLGGPPEMLDATTMSHGARVYVPGIQETEALQFTANYMLNDFETLKALEGTEHDFAVWLGATVANDIATPTGVDGKFEFKGLLTVTKNGGGVNEVQNMTITIAPSTVISQTEGGSTTPSVTLDKHALSLGIGEDYTFTAVTVPAGKTVTYTTSAAGKASVSGATVTGESAGNAIITATITDGGVDYTDTCTVVVA